MPLEIREVVIKAHLERVPPHARKAKSLDKSELLALKEEIIETCLEKIEQRLQRNFKL